MIISAKDKWVERGDLCRSPLKCRKQDDGSHACSCNVGYKVKGAGKKRTCVGKYTGERCYLSGICSSKMMFVTNQ